MLTPQEVSSHAFTKGLMGGYNMAMVDEFLDELTDDYTALYKENAALKAKMKVLVEKVEDYRATEDSMRATLLTAQKMADSIVREAEARRDNLLAQAESDARERIAQIQREVEAAPGTAGAGPVHCRRSEGVRPGAEISGGASPAASKHFLTVRGGPPGERRGLLRRRARGDSVGAGGTGRARA